jgi:2-keto-3-deoxy-L-rhamnonate aldolase RhmA
LVTIPSPAVAELLAHAGFDFLIIDMEHTGMSGSEVQMMLQAASSSDTPCVVRTGELSEVQMKHALDAGAKGIVIPHVNSEDEAKQAVRYARYAPDGSRGVTAGRAALWGLTWEEYYKSINEEVAIIALLEEPAGIDDVERIANVEGVDVVCVGLWDLSAHLGHLGDVEHPTIQEARSNAESVIHDAGKAVARYVETGKEGAAAIADGTEIIILGEDVGLLLGFARQELSELASLPVGQASATH